MQVIARAAAEAQMFACARTAETACVARFALPIFILKCAERAVAIELTMAVNIFPHVGPTAGA